MGLKGRKRRLKNFGQRARAFVKNAGKAGASSVVVRERKPLEVGANENKRLVLKNNPRHIGRAKIDEAGLIGFLEKKKIVPKTYAIVKVAASPELGVQEYFHRPSLRSLIDFIGHKDARIISRSPEDMRLCKQFLNQHKGITLERLNEAWVEFSSHLRQAKILFQIESNIIVVGQNRDGKLRLALVDV